MILSPLLINALLLLVYGITLKLKYIKKDKKKGYPRHTHRFSSWIRYSLFNINLFSLNNVLQKNMYCYLSETVKNVEICENGENSALKVKKHVSINTHITSREWFPCKGQLPFWLKVSFTKVNHFQ